MTCLAGCLAGWWLAAWATQASAQGAESQRLPLALQRSHAICPLPGREAGAWLINDAGRWAALLAAGEASLLGRAVAWGREQVLVVALAEQPTLGVRVALDDAAERLMFRRLQLAARVERPRAGEMAATALSRPCVLAVLPGGPSGAWRRVTVQLEGQRLASRSVAAGPPRAASLSPKAGAALVVPAPPAASR
jgi:hypothetical protein